MMPASTAHASLNKILVSERGQRGLTAVPLFITESAGGNDVVLRGRSPVFVSLKVLASTLETPRLAQGDLVFRGEFDGVAGPHRLAAIKAESSLSIEGGRARYYE